MSPRAAPQPASTRFHTCWPACPLTAPHLLARLRVWECSLLPQGSQRTRYCPDAAQARRLATCSVNTGYFPSREAESMQTTGKILNHTPIHRTQATWAYSAVRQQRPLHNEGGGGGEGARRQQGRAVVGGCARSALGQADTLHIPGALGPHISVSAPHTRVAAERAHPPGAAWEAENIAPVTAKVTGTRGEAETQAISRTSV